MLYMLYSMYVQGVKNRSLGTRLYNPPNTHLFNPPSIPSDSSPPPVTSPFVPISISCICLFDQIRIMESESMNSQVKKTLFKSQIIRLNQQSFVDQLEQL